jgi:hypothetical protein
MWHGFEGIFQTKAVIHRFTHQGFSFFLTENQRKIFRKAKFLSNFEGRFLGRFSKYQICFL